MPKSVKTKYRFLPIFVLLIASLSSCVKKIDDYSPTTPTGEGVTDMTQLTVPSNFNYGNNRSVSVDLHLYDNFDGPLPNVKVTFLTDAPENGGKLLATAISDENGAITENIVFPATLNEVIISTDYIGLVSNIIAPVDGGSIHYTIGGRNPQTFQTVEVPSAERYAGNQRTTATPPVVYMGTWNSLGVPNYLTTPRTTIRSEFLNRLTRSLPERKSVVSNNPTYLNANSCLELNQRTTITVNFIHEGASYKNTLAYFAYNKNNPPTSTSAISNLKVILPNSSYHNSGGGMVSGDKVVIGSFGADTVIGFALLANAYNSTTHSIGTGVAQYYSIPALNPESGTSNRIHAVYLWDDATDNLIVGFEDLNREHGSDNDFNDLIISVEAMPASAINNTGFAHTRNGHDNDNDGCDDDDDDDDDDGTTAYTDYYPSATTFGHLAFEDLWPYLGDFDFNDLVIGYRFKQNRNTHNQITSIDAKIYVKAAGGSYQNGMGIELPIPPAFIQSVTGYSVKGSMITLNGNGTEAGQTNAVIIAFDNSTNLAKRPAGYYVNTEASSPVVHSDTVNLHITFVSPMSAATLGTAPYNPFIFTNQRRCYEVHLPNKAPTSLADKNIFGTGSDKSNNALSNYYKSQQNLPWAIDVPSEFTTVLEKSQLPQAYLHFAEWCNSGGTAYPDWYMDKPGYRNTAHTMNR